MIEKEYYNGDAGEFKRDRIKPEAGRMIDASMAAQLTYSIKRLDKEKKVEDKAIKTLEDAANAVVDKVIVNEQPVKDRILTKLSMAQSFMNEAYHLGVVKNPMSADLPVFQEMQSLGKEIAAVMQKVGKVRGL